MSHYQNDQFVSNVGGSQQEMVYHIRQMNKRIALFKTAVSFRVSNSYFKDKKTRQQFVSNVNQNKKRKRF